MRRQTFAIMSPWTTDSFAKTDTSVDKSDRIVGSNSCMAAASLDSLTESRYDQTEPHFDGSSRHQADLYG